MIFQLDKKNNLVTLANSLLKYFTKKQFNDTNEYLDNILKKKNYQKIVVMLFDGLGSSILEKNLKETDFLLKNVKFEITSIFPPTTVAATNAFLSGKYPSQNGYLGWQQYFKNENKIVEMFTNYDFENKVKLSYPLLSDIYCSYESIFDIVKKETNINTAYLFPSWIKDKGANDIDDFFLKADEMLKDNHNHFYYMYWPEPDSLIHQYGTNHYLVKENIRIINNKIKKLALDNQDNLFIVLSDHSLIDTMPLNFFAHYDLISCLKRMPSLDSRAIFFHVKEDQKKRFEILFDKYYGKYFLLKNKNDILKEEIFGPKPYHKEFENFLGDYLAFTDSNYYLDYKNKNYLAQHSGSSKEEFLISVIILNI